MDEVNFFDIQIGDYVICFDEYSYDYVEHVLCINSIEHDKLWITETNPTGMACWGDDIDYYDDDENCMTVVTEANFVGFQRRAQTAIRV